MDRLEAMRQFVAIVEAGSITAAARRLRLGQPTVSKGLAALEDRLGTQLLIRSTRSQALTEGGRLFLDRARIVLDEADAAEAAVRDSRARLTGLLRIAAPPVYATQVIIPRLASFRAAYPGLHLELVLDDRMIDLVEEGVDLAVRVGDPGRGTLIGRRIARVQWLMVGATSYLERCGAPDHPDRVADHPVIAYRPFALPWRFRRNGEEVAIEPPAALLLGAAEGVRAAVLADLGLAMASDAMFASELANDIVRPVLTDWDLPGRDVWLLYPEGRRLKARARAFADWLEREVAV